MATFWTARRRIALAGMGSSGKTSFLMSLINHLENHHPAEFDLDGRRANCAISNYQRLKVKRPFPYTQLRQRLAANGLFPSKTLDHSRFRCRFDRRKSWVTYDVEFRDFAGERFADALMHGSSFQEWSTAVINMLGHDAKYAAIGKPYLDLLATSSFDEQTLIAEYKRCLYSLARDRLPLVSPSTFLLDMNGAVAKRIPEEEILQTRFSGLSSADEFAPLPDSGQSSQVSEVCACFAKRYDHYKKVVVAPHFQALRQCDRLIILVDLMEILMNGPGALFDNYEVIKLILGAAIPASGLLSGALKFLGNAGANVFFLPVAWRPSGIKKVCFVATKRDKVADHGNLVPLLQNMLRGLGNHKAFKNITFDYQAASAIVSARPCPFQDHDGGEWLQGRPLLDESENSRMPTDELVSFQLGKSIPSTWPDDWCGSEYWFPDVYPDAPKAPFQPPQQRGLDAILKFALAR